MTKEIKPRDNVFQSNHITQSHLPFTKLESDIFTIILASLNPETTEYSFNIKELMDYLNIKTENYKTLINSINNLYEKSIIIKHKQHENLGNYTEKIRLLSRIKYLNGDEKVNINDTITLNISTEIQPHLFNLKEFFTSYETQSFLRLSSITSKKLYTIFSQYKNTGKILLSKSQIQEVLGTNYKEFSVLMTKHIKPAIKEIERETNVSQIKIKPIKKGTKIVSYYFLFDYHLHQLEIPLLSNQTTLENLKQIERLQEEFNLTLNQSKIIIENISVKDINKTLYQIKLLDTDKKVNNIGGYTLTVFKNKYKLKF
jgi:plasmid replication initiation protein